MHETFSISSPPGNDQINQAGAQHTPQVTEPFTMDSIKCCEHSSHLLLVGKVWQYLKKLNTQLERWLSG